MSPLLRANTVSTEHTGNLVLPARKHRSYFFITFTVGTGTVEFGGGGGKIPLGTAYHYAPAVAPIGEISIETTGGTYIIHEG